jgi:hypothetical protein
MVGGEKPNSTVPAIILAVLAENTGQMQGLVRQQLDFIEPFNSQIPQFQNCSIPESFSPSIRINNIPRENFALQNGNQKRQKDIRIEESLNS